MYGAHCLSLDALPATDSYVSAGQIVKGAQLGALSVVLKVPSAHGLHTRSLTPVPSVLTKLPAAQSETATHPVAASASSSHVPVAQGAAAASPPAQNIPAPQGSQTVRSVALRADPGSQVAASPQATAFTPLNSPSAQGLQVRSVSFDPALST